jgi:hypothetical protein
MTDNAASDGEIIDGKTILKVLNNLSLIQTGATRVQVVAAIDGYMSINAEYFIGPPPGLATDELDRLREIEALTAKIVKLLNEGQVDYDMVTQLGALLNV